MHYLPPCLAALSLWKRIAVALSFLAIWVALIAPASMLAEEVRTGKLGGLCSATSQLTVQDAGDMGSAGTSQMASHCDLCGSLTLAPPLLPALAMPALPTGERLAFLASPVVLAAAIPGLPPGRGPPSHL